jgi:hypothetical protein
VPRPIEAIDDRPNIAARMRAAIASTGPEASTRSQSTTPVGYEGTGDNDEAGYRFGAHAFKLGEYVSIRDP